MPVIRRYLTRLSAAGVTAALALTGAVSDASASPAANPPARVVTLTSNSSAPTGHLTVKVRYQLEPGGRNKVLSVTFSGASKVSLKHPALIVSLRPVALLPMHHRGQRLSVRVIAFTLILKLHNSRQFSGALPAKVLTTLDKIFAAPRRLIHGAGSVLSAAVASVDRSGRRPAGVAVPAGLQVGILLGPAAP